MANSEKLVGMLRTMHRIRCFEEALTDLYDYRASFDRSHRAADEYDFQSKGLVAGAVHLCIGQEAAAVGTCAALQKDDYVVSTHRGHGHAIAKGADIGAMMAELMGRETGCSGGFGGSMHLFDPDIGLLGGNGIVGGGIPIAMGAAFSAKYRGTRQVAVAFFSEGASNQGTFHESLNMAALWELPVIYVCENNLYAASTPIEIGLAKPDIAGRASAYGMTGRSVDGMDVTAVYEAVSEAVAAAREGLGPTLIECKTFRFVPHCGASKGHNSPEQLAKWIEKDPIVQLERRLLDAGVLREAALEEMKTEVADEVARAVEFAKASEFPSIRALEAIG